jgi:hypothetical protein
VTERERLFDWCVDQVQAGRMTLDQCIERYASDDLDLADMLRTVEILRGLTIPDVHTARTRVRSRLMASMSQDTAHVTDDSTAPIARRASPATIVRTARRRRVRLLRHPLAGVAAAALLTCGLLGWGSGQAAADALPGNPLYAVKRAEEWVTLQTAVGDARRGVVLATLADHRLAEASAEARTGNVSQARALLREYDDDVRQAVALSAAMTARGEDARPVLVALAVDLAHAQQFQLEAAGQGNGTFAQLLQASVTSDQQIIRDDHLTLPDASSGPNRQGQSTASPGSHGRQGNPTATPSNASTPTSGEATPPNNGNGNGSGGGHGHGTPTPSIGH